MMRQYKVQSETYEQKIKEHQEQFRARKDHLKREIIQRSRQLTDINEDFLELKSLWSQYFHAEVREEALPRQPEPRKPRSQADVDRFGMHMAVTRD